MQLVILEIEGGCKMRIKIKKIKDLENTLGKTLSKNVLKFGGGTKTKKPSSVTFTEKKPIFYLNEGSTLHAYAIDLTTVEILGGHYCGSSDTTIHHQPEQLGEGYKAPKNNAIMFIEYYWNGKNMGWELTIVSDNIQKQLN